MTEAQLNIIKKALYDVEMLELKKLESLPNANAVYSQEYIKKKDALIRREQKREASLIKWPLKKNIIIFAAMISLLALTVTACVFRKQIKEFVFKVYDAYTLIYLDAEKPQQLQEIYELTYIPDEYEVVENTVYPTSVINAWSDGVKEIVLIQTAVGTNVMTIDTENAQYETIQIENITLYCTYKNNANTFLWNMGENTFLMTCPDTTPWEDVERMILNMEKK